MINNKIITFLRNRNNNRTLKKFYAQLINKNDLCFDIGANIGQKSRLFLSLNAKVVAFEPQTKCFKYLDKINHPNFEFYPLGVGGKNQKKQLHLANHIEVATFSNKMIDFYTTNSLNWNNIEEAQVKKLDTLIKEFGLPNFCKIDTEGYELDIISNLSYTIPIIEFEFNEAFIEDTLKIISILDKKNTAYNYILNENPKFILENWVEADKMRLIINEMPKEKLHGNIFVKNS